MSPRALRYGTTPNTLLVATFQGLRRRCVILFAPAVLLVACVTVEPPKPDEISQPFRQHYEAGVRAEGKADYRAAQREYAQAYKIAEDDKLGPAALSAATYELGRVTGYLCDYSRAHRLLRQSLEIEERVSGPYSANTSARYMELARLNYDNGRYAQAVPYYERAIPLLEKLDVDKRDPLGFAEALDEFGASLSHIGATSEAQRVLRRADRMRAQNSNRARSYIPRRYDRNCPRT